MSKDPKKRLNRCGDCDHTFHSDDVQFKCPKCGSKAVILAPRMGFLGTSILVAVFAFFLFSVLFYEDNKEELVISISESIMVIPSQTEAEERGEIIEEFVAIAIYEEKLDNLMTISIKKEISIDHAVFLLCKEVDVPYQKGRSLKNVQGLDSMKIKNLIVNEKSGSEAIKMLLLSRGLSYIVNEKGLYIE